MLIESMIDDLEIDLFIDTNLCEVVSRVARLEKTVGVFMCILSWPDPDLATSRRGALLAPPQDHGISGDKNGGQDH